MTTSPDDDFDPLWPDKPGIVIRAPHHLSPARAIPLKIDVAADIRTDDALHGFLEGAVSLALVRQDRPGVFLGAAFDPHLSGYPEDHLLDDVSRSEPPVQRDPRDLSGQRIEYQTGHRFVDRGSGRYFLLGAFAKWWAPPQVIDISDPGGPAPSDQQPLPVAATALAPPRVPPARPILAIGGLGGRRFLRVTLPPGATAGASSPAEAAKPFFTIVGFHLQTHGGSVGAVFAPQVSAATTRGGIESTVSFAALASFNPDQMNRREIPGHWVFLLFHGDQVSEPLSVTLAKADY